MLYVYLISFLVCLTTPTYSFEVCNAEDSLGQFEKVEIAGCPNVATTHQKCLLRRPSNVTLELTFTLSEDVKAVKSVVQGIVLGVPAPFPLPNSDGCVNSGLTCPLAKGGTYTYKSAIFASKSHPKLLLTVYWELLNEDGKTIVCMLVPSKLV